MGQDALMEAIDNISGISFVGWQGSTAADDFAIEIETGAGYRLTADGWDPVYPCDPTQKFPYISNDGVYYNLIGETVDTRLAHCCDWLLRLALFEKNLKSAEPKEEAVIPNVYYWKDGKGHTYVLGPNGFVPQMAPENCIFGVKFGCVTGFYARPRDLGMVKFYLNLLNDLGEEPTSFDRLASIIEQHYLLEVFDRATTPYPPGEVIFSRDGKYFEYKDNNWVECGRPGVEFKKVTLGNTVYFRHVGEDMAGYIAQQAQYFNRSMPGLEPDSCSELVSKITGAEPTSIKPVASASVVYTALKLRRRDRVFTLSPSTQNLVPVPDNGESYEDIPGTGIGVHAVPAFLEFASPAELGYVRWYIENLKNEVTRDTNMVIDSIRSSAPVEGFGTPNIKFYMNYNGLYYEWKYDHFWRCDMPDLKDWVDYDEYTKLCWETKPSWNQTRNVKFAIEEVHKRAALYNRVTVKAILRWFANSPEYSVDIHVALSMLLTTGNIRLDVFPDQMTCQEISNWLQENCPDEYPVLCDILPFSLPKAVEREKFTPTGNLLIDRLMDSPTNTDWPADTSLVYTGILLRRDGHLYRFSIDHKLIDAQKPRSANFLKVPNTAYEIDAVEGASSILTDMELGFIKFYLKTMSTNKPSCYDPSVCLSMIRNAIANQGIDIPNGNIYMRWQGVIFEFKYNRFYGMRVNVPTTFDWYRLDDKVELSWFNEPASRHLNGIRWAIDEVCRGAWSYEPTAYDIISWLSVVHKDEPIGPALKYLLLSSIDLDQALENCILSVAEYIASDFPDQFDAISNLLPYKLPPVNGVGKPIDKTGEEVIAAVLFRAEVTDEVSNALMDASKYLGDATKQSYKNIAEKLSKYLMLKHHNVYSEVEAFMPDKFPTPWCSKAQFISAVQYAYAQNDNPEKATPDFEVYFKYGDSWFSMGGKCYSNPVSDDQHFESFDLGDGKCYILSLNDKYVDLCADSIAYRMKEIAFTEGPVKSPAYEKFIGRLASYTNSSVETVQKNLEAMGYDEQYVIAHGISIIGEYTNKFGNSTPVSKDAPSWVSEIRNAKYDQLPPWYVMLDYHRCYVQYKDNYYMLMHGGFFKVQGDPGYDFYEYGNGVYIASDDGPAIVKFAGAIRCYIDTLTSVPYEESRFELEVADTVAPSFCTCPELKDKMYAFFGTQYYGYDGQDFYKINECPRGVQFQKWRYQGLLMAFRCAPTRDHRTAVAYALKNLLPGVH